MAAKGPEENGIVRGRHGLCWGGRRGRRGYTLLVLVLVPLLSSTSTSLSRSHLMPHSLSMLVTAAETGHRRLLPRLRGGWGGGPETESEERAHYERLAAEREGSSEDSYEDPYSLSEDEKEFAPENWYEGMTCEEYDQAVTLKRNLPVDNDHAPWLDAWKEAYLEVKAHNYTAMREKQMAGENPPACPLMWHGTGKSRQPFCVTWDQYWDQWELEWGCEPPFATTGFQEPTYRRPFVTDRPPRVGVGDISVDEEVVWHGEHLQGAFPDRWPEALDSVLDDEYDNVNSGIALNLALLHAARDGDIERCASLVSGGAQIHAGDTGNYDMTPLHHAAYSGHAELCDVLVREMGAEVDRITLGGETALYKAVQGNRSEVVRVLLALGANPNHRTGRNQSLGTTWTPLHRAACQGYAECASLLLSAGADPNAEGHTGWRPLHYAAVWAHVQVVRLLVEGGADVFARNLVGNHTALDKVWESRFCPDSGPMKMRTRYRQVIEYLREKMGEEGLKVPSGVPPHWRHGNKSADEVTAEHWNKFGHFRNGSFMEAWRLKMNMTRPDQELIKLVRDMSRPHKKHKPGSGLVTCPKCRDEQRSRHADGGNLALRGGGILGFVGRAGTDNRHAFGRAGTDNRHSFGRAGTDNRLNVILRGGGQRGEEEGGVSGGYKVMGMRAMHITVNVDSRRDAESFLVGVLGMKVLRHEEMAGDDFVGPQKGTKHDPIATLRGRWSRTIFGYADEASSFCIEVIYRHAVRGYRGGVLEKVVILNRDVYSAVTGQNQVKWERGEEGGVGTPNSAKVRGLGGLLFEVVDRDSRGGAVGWRVVIKAGDVLEASRFYKHALALEETLEGAQGGGAHVDEGVHVEGAQNDEGVHVEGVQVVEGVHGEGGGIEGLEGAFVRPGGGDSKMRDEYFGTGNTVPGGTLFEKGTVPAEILVDEKEEREGEGDEQGEGEGRVGGRGMGEGDGEGGGGDTGGEGEILYFPRPRPPGSVTLRGDAEGVVLLVIKGGGSDETVENLRYGGLGIGLPASWMDGVQSLLKAYSGVRILSPLLNVDYSGLGVVPMLAASAPFGGGDVKLYGDQAYRDMAQVDDFAHLLFQKEIEADDADELLDHRHTQNEARAMLGESPLEPIGGDDGPLEMFEVPPREGEHGGTLVWLHGSGQTSDVRAFWGDDQAKGWSIFCASLQDYAPSFKMLLPSAPVRAVDALLGHRRPSWFDYRCTGRIYQSSPVDIGSESSSHLRSTSSSLRQIVDADDSQSMPFPPPFVLGGFGTGAVASLFTAFDMLSSGKPLRGLLLCNGWLPKTLPPLKEGGGKGVDVLVVAGGVDDCVTKEMCKALHLELLRLGFNSSLVEEESVAHNIVPNLQCEYIGTFLNSLALGGGIDQAENQRRRAEVDAEIAKKEEGARRAFELRFGVKLDQEKPEMSFQDAANPSEMDKEEDEVIECAILLSRPPPVPKGGRIVVFGDSKGLGGGKPDKGVAMHGTEGEVRAVVMIKAFSRCKYQFAVVGPGGDATVVEPGGTRSFAVHRRGVRVRDEWGARLPTVSSSLADLGPSKR